MALQHARFGCAKHEDVGSRHSRSSVTKWMRGRAAEHVDPRTNIANTTSLAEAAAHEFDHPEWCDDSNHWVWEAAIAAADAAGFGDHA